MKLWVSQACAEVVASWGLALTGLWERLLDEGWATRGAEEECVLVLAVSLGLSSCILSRTLFDPLVGLRGQVVGRGFLF